MAILIPAAFVAGVIVAVSPCVLPVLPIVLAGGGAAGTRRRPYAIVAGLVATFAAFLLVFSIGLAAPLLAIATGSRRAAASLRANGQTIRIAAGVVVALMAVALYNGWAARVQTAVPGYVKWAQDLVEGNHSVKRELAHLRERDRS